MTTDNLALLTEAELETKLAEKVSVPCYHASTPEQIECSNCMGAEIGSGRRWLLRGECPGKHVHEFYDGTPESPPEEHNHGVTCPDCSGLGYVYSGDYDGLLAACRELGFVIHLFTADDEDIGDHITLWSRERVRAAGADWSDTMIKVEPDEGITGLRAIKVAVLRAVEVG